MATLQRNLRIHPDWKSDANKHKIRLTKIVCTIGPKTKDIASLEELLAKGMDVMRLNFSHGTHEVRLRGICSYSLSTMERSLITSEQQ